MHFFDQFSLPYPKYQRLTPLEEDSTCDKDEDVMHARRLGERYGRQPRWRATAAVYAVMAALVTYLTIISTLYIQHMQQQENYSPRPLLTCGTTVHEAMNAGCTFDRLTKAWLPAACSRKYEDEFLDYPVTQLNMTTPWQYYEDTSSARVEITDYDMALYAETRPAGAMSWASTPRMHLAHCAFVLMRRVDAEETGARVDKTTAFAPHMKHCLTNLLRAAMDSPHIDKVIATGQAGFGAC